jgi:hypothetical protein
MNKKENPALGQDFFISVAVISAIEGKHLFYHGAVNI